MAVGQIFFSTLWVCGSCVGFRCQEAGWRVDETLPELAEWMRTVGRMCRSRICRMWLQRLARGRLLRSHRGIAGGYSLGRSAVKISLRDLVELLEGVDVNRCGLSVGGCRPRAISLFHSAEVEQA